MPACAVRLACAAARLTASPDSGNNVSPICLERWYAQSGIDQRASWEASRSGRSHQWMTNENHQRRGNRPLKACVKQRPRKKRKTRARWGTICLRGPIVSKSAPKAPMEKAQNRNKKGESSRPFLRARCNLSRSCPPKPAFWRRRMRERSRNARVKAFASGVVSHRGNTLSPALSRKRERECSSIVAAMEPAPSIRQETPPIFSETILAALRNSAAMALASAAGI
ncbi:hypothetical protein ABIA40_005412 [Bradyrhizobium sp. USDA 223]